MSRLIRWGDEKDQGKWKTGISKTKSLESSIAFSSLVVFFQVAMCGQRPKKFVFRNCEEVH